MQKGFSVRIFDYTYSYYMHYYAPETPEQAKEPLSRIILLRSKSLSSRVCANLMRGNTKTDNLWVAPKIV